MNTGYTTTLRVISLFYFIQGINFATWASRIPDIKNSLGLSEATLGSVLFGIPIGQMCAMALSAWAVKRFSSINTLSLASIICPLSLLPIGVVTTPIMLFIVLFIFGASTNLYNISVNTQGVDIERLYSKNIMSSLHGLWSLGGFIGGVMSMGLTSIGINAFQHFIIICIASIIITMCFRSKLIKEDVGSEGDDRITDRETPSAWRRFDSYIIMLGIMAFAAMVTEGAMYDWSGVYFSDVVDAPDNLIRLGYIVCMCTMTIGRFLGDKVKSKIGTINLIRTSGVLITLGLLIAILFPTMIGATIGFFIVGFGISSTVPICYSLAGHSETLSPSVALAAVSTIGYLGFLIGPPTIGFIAHAISLRWTFGVIAIIGLFIIYLAGRLQRKICI